MSFFEMPVYNLRLLSEHTKGLEYTFVRASDNSEYTGAVQFVEEFTKIPDCISHEMFRVPRYLYHGSYKRFDPREIGKNEEVTFLTFNVFCAHSYALGKAKGIPNKTGFIYEYDLEDPMVQRILFPIQIDTKKPLKSDFYTELNEDDRERFLMSKYRGVKSILDLRGSQNVALISNIKEKGSATELVENFRD